VAAIEEIKKELEKTKKALADTKASYTKGQQELAAIKAELKIFEERGPQIPAEIAALKTEEPEKYAAALEKYNNELSKTRAAKAKEARDKVVMDTIAKAAKDEGMTVEEVQANVPPKVYEAYVAGDLSSQNVVALAKQYSTSGKIVQSPTTQQEFDFSAVAGGLVSGVEPEKDETLNDKDYII
jgi:septal ring factor EnvC (AmiA/AmiB activator)